MGFNSGFKGLRKDSFLTGAQDSRLQRVTIPEAAYIYNYDVDLLMMSRVNARNV